MVNSDLLSLLRSSSPTEQNKPKESHHANRNGNVQPRRAMTAQWVGEPVVLEGQFLRWNRADSIIGESNFNIVLDFWAFTDSNGLFRAKVLHEIVRNLQSGFVICPPLVRPGQRLGISRFYLYFYGIILCLRIDDAVSLICSTYRWRIGKIEPD